MARKLKGFNIKRLFVDHGEKLAFGVVLVMVVLGLAGTSWVPYSRQPSEFLALVDDAKKNIANTTWPEEEREKFVLKDEERPHRIVDAGINDRIQVTPDYLQSQPQWKDKNARNDPLLEPEYRPVVSMEASEARVLIRLLPKWDDALASTDGARVADVDGAGTNPGRLSATEEERPDEFLGGRGRPVGGFGAPTAGNEADFGMPFGRGARDGRDYQSFDAPELLRSRGAGQAGSGRRRGAQRGGPGARIADVDGGGPTARRNRGARRGGSRGFVEEGDEVFGATPVVPGVDTPAMGGMYAGMEEDGKAYPFVSVRGVFEFREQVRLYTQAIHKTYTEALQYFMIVDFKLERQRLLNAPDKWTAWEPVNDQVFRDILKAADGFDPEVVDPAVTDAAITCPLPARLTGMYNQQATHEKLKEYTLSPEEMAKEIEYQELLLKNVIEQKKNVPEGLVVKKGFADMTFDSRSLSQAYFGGMSSYGGGMRMADEADEDFRGMPTRGPFGGPAGRGAGLGSARGAAGQRGQRPNEMLNKSIDDLLRQWTEKNQEVGSPEAKEDLKKWISARTEPQGDLLLFRYFDFDVEPGQTYRYRVQLELQNPNFNAPIAATGGVASVREGSTRWTPWSEPTPAIRVSPTVSYFLTNVQPPRSLVHPQARMNVFQYDLDVGTVVQQELDVAMGQNVGGKARTEQADPAKRVVDNVDYTFKSNDILIDVIPDVRFSRTEHPDLQLPADSRGLTQMPEMAAVVTPHGKIEVVDPMSQQSSLERAKRYKQMQDENFANLRSADQPVGGGGGYGYIADDDTDNMSMDVFTRAGGPAGRNNPLRRGGFGAGRGR